MSEPLWFDAEQAIELNAVAVAETGEPHLLLSRGMLESAVNRPQFKYQYDEEDDLCVLAAELCVGLVLNHCFHQGNKRTGYFAIMSFIEQNGYGFAPQDDEIWADTIIQLTDQDLREDALEQLTTLIRNAIVHEQFHYYNLGASTDITNAWPLMEDE